jgi:hypothetical protein
MENPTKQIASLARRLAAGTTRVIADAKQRLALSDETAARFKAKVRTRRRMMDAALRKRRSK